MKWLVLSKFSPTRYMLLVMIAFIGILHGQSPPTIQGIGVVAPPDPITVQSFTEIKDLGATHVSIIPYGYSRPNSPKLWFNTSRQWWGEGLIGAKTSVQLAHKAGLQVMLKPQVYVPGGWIGNFKLPENQWPEWEKAYTEFIMSFARIADEEGVEIFCLGTEVKTSIAQRPAFWNKLIAKIKTVYCGKLVYSANWDNYQDIPFWGLLDYVGVSSYFPLSEKKTPSVSNLIQEWKPIVKALEAFSDQLDRPILFTEYGYLSVDGAAGKTWELEGKVHQLQINEQAQANALEALYAVFCKTSFWAGGFLWKWFPDGQGHEGYFNKDYTPQGKLSQKIIEKRFQ